jgi:thymidylate synthase
MKQFRQFNYHYEIDFEEVMYFDWDFQMGPVRYEGYEVLATNISWIIESLNKDPNTRQAILTLNTKDYMSCLISIQWLIDETTLYCITNFRSQHREWGRPQDSQLILWLTTQIKAQLETQIDKVKIEVNVADYHSIC